MQNRKMMSVVCDNPDCRQQFEKPESEYKRNIQLGRRNYCSKTCLGTINIENFGSMRNTSTTHLNAGNRRDQFTGFRTLLRRIKYRDPETDITLEFLKELFDRQEGKCVYTDIPLTLPEKNQRATPNSASIDRIDSSINYLQSNIQYVAMPINLMKGTMSHQETIDFLNLIRA